MYCLKETHERDQYFSRMRAAKFERDYERDAQGNPLQELWPRQERDNKGKLKAPEPRRLIKKFPGVPTHVSVMIST